MSTNYAEVAIKRLSKEDVQLAQQLIRVFQKVFEMEHESMIENSNLTELLENSAFIAYAAIHHNKVVGGLTAYVLPRYYSNGSEVFIYDVGVLSGYRRKGIGKMLLNELIRYCQLQGIQELFVAAHEEDTHALDFYHATGGRAEKVVHFTYYGK